MSNELSIFFNGLLVGAAGYACFKITPADPFAFSGCALACCHGIIGLATNIMFHCTENDSGCQKLKAVSASLQETVPLPLVNIQLYLNSAQNNNLAMGHGFFVIPAVYDVYIKLFTVDMEDNSTEALKDLTVLGNIVSLVFLAVNENRFVYGAMAFVAFLTRYGSWLLETLYEGTGENCSLFGEAVFAMLTAKAFAMKSFD